MGTDVIGIANITEENTCFNCGGKMDDGDHFCKTCGAGKGDGLRPQKTFYTPLRYRVKGFCSCCNIEFFNVQENDDYVYCPRCGQKTDAEMLETIESDWEAMLREFEENETLFNYELFFSPVGKNKGQSKNIDFSNEVDEASCSLSFSKSVTKADKIDYEIAFASGVITSLLDILWVKDFSLEDAKKIGSDEVEKLVINVAKEKAGFVPKGDDQQAILQKAIHKLEKTFPIPADLLSPQFGDGKFHHFRDFVHHPTILGLLFSILSQFTECGFGTDVNGQFRVYKIPEDKLGEHLIGKTIPQKIAFGTINWAFHLISDIDGSSNNPGRGTGIPGPVLAFFKELSSLPFFKNVRIDYRNKDINLSTLMQKIFDGTLFADHDENGRIIKGTEKPVDFRTELGIANNVIKSSLPVIANECIVKAFYFIRRICLEIKAKKVKSIKDIRKLNPENFLPTGSRELKRMLTVSSGTFMTIVTAKDAVAAAIKSKGDKKEFAKYFLLNVNYFGIVSFTVACKNDAGYISEDIKKVYKEYVEEQRREAAERNQELSGVKNLILNEIQTRILYSLKWQKVLYDIESTEDPKRKVEKQEWFEDWVKFEIQPDEGYIVESERKLYAMIKQEIAKAEGFSWMHLVSLELDVFDPYYPVDPEKKIPRGLKLTSDYITDVFCVKQKVVGLGEVKKLHKSYVEMESKILNKAAKRAIGATAVVVVGAASGGLGYAFAPEIAVIIAGESFAGLSGAALTSASLAALGGGAIAAGGMGMAGGTAFIAGGGALIGIVSSGAMSLSSEAFLSSKDNVLKECTKLLTFCKSVLIEKRLDLELVKKIKTSLSLCTDQIDSLIEKEASSDHKNKKKVLSGLKVSKKYIDRSCEHLDKMLADKSTLILSDAVNAFRKTGIVWYYFETGGKYIIATSSDVPKMVRNIVPGVGLFQVDKKTGEVEFLPVMLPAAKQKQFNKGFEKGVTLVDISNEEFEERL